MKFIHLFHLKLRKDKTFRERVDQQSSKVRILDHIVMFLAFIMPLTLLPQVIKMNVTQSVGDISIISFILLLILTIPWLLYGIVHKEKVLITNNIAWMLLHVSVIISYFIYS